VPGLFQGEWLAGRVKTRFAKPKPMEKYGQYSFNIPLTNFGVYVTHVSLRLVFQLTFPFARAQARWPSQKWHSRFKPHLRIYRVEDSGQILPSVLVSLVTFRE
jgi:hypothetical protein